MSTCVGISTYISIADPNAFDADTDPGNILTDFFLMETEFGQIPYIFCPSAKF